MQDHGQELSDILSERELKNDLEAVVLEQRWSKTAFGQQPAVSYNRNTWYGPINTENLLAVAAGEINRLRTALSCYTDKADENKDQKYWEGFGDPELK